MGTAKLLGLSADKVERTGKDGKPIETSTKSEVTLDERSLRLLKLLGALFYDANGSGGAGTVQFATLTTRPALTSLDFVVI